MTGSGLPNVSYLIEVIYTGEADDDLGACHMVTQDICDLIEGHYTVRATLAEGFDRLKLVAQEILDTHYPFDVFGAADIADTDSADPGVRLVRALRAVFAAEDRDV